MKMINSFTKQSIFIGLLVIASCSVPFDDTDFSIKLNQEYAIPLIETSLQFENLIDGFDGDTYLQLLPDGTFTMRYQTAFEPKTKFDLFATMPEPNPIPILFQNTGISFPTPNGVRIDEMVFSTGFFRWKMRSPNDTLTVKLTIPQLLKNGQAFEKTFKVSSEEYSGQENLKDWRLVPFNGNIVFSYEAKKANGESVSLTNMGSYQFSKYQAKSVIGSFGTQTIPALSDSVALDFFKTWRTNGMLKFADPKIRLSIENSYGVPLLVQPVAADMKFKDGQVRALTGGLSGSFLVGSPSVSQMGGSVTSTAEINKNNSNILDLLNNYPTEFKFQLAANFAQSNGTKGYILDNSNLKTKLDFEIPFVGTANAFVYRDTLDINLSPNTEVKSAEFKIITNNSMPFDLALQGYFYNPAGQIIDSLVSTTEPLILKSAQTNGSGIVVAPTETTTFIKADEAKFNRLRAAQKFVAKYTLTSSNNATETVRVTRFQRFGLKIGLKTGVTLKP